MVVADQHEGDALLGPRRSPPEAEPTAASSSSSPPLASSSSRPRRPAHRTMASVASLAGSLHVPKAHRGDTIVTLLCVVLLVIMFSTGFYVIPLTRIVEDVVCRQYYLDHPTASLPDGGGPIDEKLCKLPPIQADVAFVFASCEAAGSVASFLAALPWGIVADRIGRKPVVSAALLGLGLQILWIMMILYWHTVFPIWTIYISAGFVLIGGGSALLSGIVLSILSDVIEEDKRAMAFVKVHITSVVGGLLSPSFASLMMRFTGPWPLLWVAELCLVVGGLLFLFLPETAPRKVASGGGGGDDNDDDDDDDGANAADIAATDLAGHARHVYRRVRESLSILQSPSLVVLLLTTLASTPIAAACLQFLIQFVSKRYGLALQDTGYVQTAFGAAQVLHGLVLLPAISRLLLVGDDDTPPPPPIITTATTTAATTPTPTPPRPWWHHPNEQQRDLTLARASYALLALGFVLMGAAPTLPAFVVGLAVLALGSGANSLGRSLMSLYVDRAHRTRLFSLVGMAETVGAVYGPGLLAALFALGMRLDGPWIGLPYWGVAALCLLVLASLFCIRLPRHRKGDDDDDDSSDGDDVPPPYEDAGPRPEPYRD